MLRFSVACVFAAFCVVGLTGFQHPATVSGNPLVRKLAGYRVEVSTAELGGSEREVASYWGGYGPTTSRVTRMRVWRGDHEVPYVPRSAYADLSQVHRLDLVKSKNGITVEIEGGDASTGYTARIVIRGNDVVSRSVHSGEFPDNFWEKTEYHSQDPGG